MFDDNFKDQLMRWCQARKLELPQYPILSHENSIFKVSVVVNSQVVGWGGDKIKKQANSP